MKGLLRKEWYLLKRHCRTYLVIAAVFLAMSAVNMTAGGGNMFLTFYPSILAGIIPGTLLAYDEQSRWNVYSDTLACTRAQVVSAKYLVGLGLEAAMMLLCAAVSAARMSRSGAVFGGELLFLQVGLMALIALLVPAVTLPLMLRFGVEKGRIFFFVTVAATCAVSVGLSNTLLGDAPNSLQIPSGIGLVAALAILLGLILYGLSWLISIRLYQKREL